MNDQQDQSNNSTSGTATMADHVEHVLQEQEIRRLRQENAQLKEQLRLRDRDNAQLKVLVRKALGKERISSEGDISEDDEFVEAALKALKLRQIRWGDVPEDLKRTHEEMALFGVSKNLINADDCPCLLDRSSMREHYSNGVIEWENLPTGMRRDINFARSIERFRDIDSVEEIFEYFPQLRQERAMWEKAVETTYSKFGSSDLTISRFAPDAIKSDRELMLQACAKNVFVMDYLDENLAQDHGFLLELAGRKHTMLWHMSHELQLRFPDIVDRALQRSSEGGEGEEDTFFWRGHIGAMVERLAPEFWRNRDFVLRWFRLGLPFLGGGAHRELNRGSGPFRDWKADKEIFLLVARHSRFRRQSFARAAVTLRRDKKFMLQVLEIAPSLISGAASQLRKDFDACLLAFSGEQNVVQSEVERRQALREEQDDRSELDYVELFRSQVSTRLRAHSIFSTIVLPAMSQTTESRCTLAVLNQGAETSRSYKKRMAEYLDIPTGKRLRLHRQADHNLNAVVDGGNDE